MAESLGNKPVISKQAGIISFIMIIIVGVLSNYIYCLSVYVEPLSQAYGWSMNTIVLAYSASMFCEIPAYLIGGWCCKFFGTKRVMVVSGILYGLAILGSGLTSSVTVFVICQGIIGSLSMYGVYIATIQLINALFPHRKGLVMGVLYGSQAAGGALLAPIAVYFIGSYSVATALILQGIIFTVIMFICSMLISDPTKGNKELMHKIQEEAEAEEAAEAVSGKTDETLPIMRWKKVFTYPAFWYFFISLIFIQVIGNVLITDISVLSTKNFDVSSADAAWVVSAFNIGAGLGGIVIGYISDKIGPYKTTFLLGIVDGVLLLILAITGSGSFMVFAVMCIIQGFTYNGMTTLNPIMLTDSYAAEDLGITMGAMGVAYAIVGSVGPQIGLAVPFVPMIVVCAVLSIIGGFLARMSGKSLNKYYESIGSQCRVK